MKQEARSKKQEARSKKHNEIINIIFCLSVLFVIVRFLRSISNSILSNYLITFLVIIIISGLIFYNKDRISVLKEDLVSFIFDNRFYWISVVLVCILSYGFTLTNYSISVDDECINPSMNGYLLGQGRFGMSHFFQLIFNAFECLPFWIDFLGLLVFQIAAIVWSIFYIRVSGKKLTKNYTIIFASMLISSPIIAHLFIFMGCIYSIALIFLLIGFSLYVLQSNNSGLLIHKSDISVKLLSKLVLIIILISISIALIEWAVVAFMLGYFTGLFLECISGADVKKRYPLNVLFLNIILIVCMLILAIVANKAITSIFQYVNGITMTDYRSHYMLWNIHGNMFIQFKKMIHNLIKVFCHGGLFNKVFVMSLIINSLIAFLFCVKNKSIVPLLILVCIVGSAFSFNIITCNPHLEPRIYIYLAIFIAFSFMLIVYVLFSIKFGEMNGKHNYLYSMLTKSVRIIILFFVILITLYQTKELSRLFYHEYLRYEADVRTAYNIIHEIELLSVSLTKPVVFVGPFKSNATIRFGYVIFNQDRCITPELMLSQGRIINFIKQLGYNMNYVTSKNSLNLALVQSKNMPSYPKRGSIKEFNDYVIVKFGDVINPTLLK